MQMSSLKKAFKENSKFQLNAIIFLLTFLFGNLIIIISMFWFSFLTILFLFGGYIVISVILVYTFKRAEIHYNYDNWFNISRAMNYTLVMIIAIISFAFYFKAVISDAEFAFQIFPAFLFFTLPLLAVFGNKGYELKRIEGKRIKKITLEILRYLLLSLLIVGGYLIYLLQKNYPIIPSDFPFEGVFRFYLIIPLMLSIPLIWYLLGSPLILHGHKRSRKEIILILIHSILLLGIFAYLLVDTVIRITTTTHSNWAFVNNYYIALLTLFCLILGLVILLHKKSYTYDIPIEKRRTRNN